MLYSSILFPAFLVITLFVIIVPVVIIAVYLQIYKRHINNALNNKDHRTPMASPHKVIIVSAIVVLFIGVFASLFVGYKTAQNYYEASIDQFSATDLETYYAEVKEVNEKTLTVKGLSINEEKYQGEFQYEIAGQVTIVQGNEIITLSELEQGDIVSIILISGEGRIKGITDVFKITFVSEAK